MSADRADSTEPHPQIHGGPVTAELAALGLDPDLVVDFSVNVNPYGPAPEMREAIRAAPIDRYPDPAATLARRALADVTHHPPEKIVLGHGAAELLWTFARVLVPPGETALMVEPTFSEFRLAVLAGGGRLVEWRARPEAGFAGDLGAVAAAARAARARAVYLCSPNNPTGLGSPHPAIAELAERIAPAVLVLDEAFLSLSERHADAARPLPGNTVRVRSLTKEHAIPGVRVGYAIAVPALAAAAER